jgi:hypothetical protein
MFSSTFLAQRYLVLSVTGEAVMISPVSSLPFFMAAPLQGG